MIYTKLWFESTALRFASSGGDATNRRDSRQPEFAYIIDASCIKKTVEASMNVLLKSTLPCSDLSSDKKSWIQEGEL